MKTNRIMVTHHILRGFVRVPPSLGLGTRMRDVLFEGLTTMHNCITAMQLMELNSNFRSKKFVAVCQIIGFCVWNFPPTIPIVSNSQMVLKISCIQQTIKLKKCYFKINTDKNMAIFWHWPNIEDCIYTDKNWVH